MATEKGTFGQLLHPQLQAWSAAPCGRASCNCPSPLPGDFSSEMGSVLWAPNTLGTKGEQKHGERQCALRKGIAGPSG